MTLHVFREPRVGFVAHTAASRLLADPCMLDWLGNTCEETWPAAVRVGALSSSSTDQADLRTDCGCNVQVAGVGGTEPLCNARPSLHSVQLIVAGLS